MKKNKKKKNKFVLLKGMVWRGGVILEQFIHLPSTSVL